MYRQPNQEALAELIETSGLHFKKSASSFIFDCPRCQKKDKLYIRRTTGQFICFVCAETLGFKGRPEYALAELLGMTVQAVSDLIYDDKFDASKESISDFLDFSFPDDESEEEIVQITHIPIIRPFDFFDIGTPQAKLGEEYLLKRGIDRALAQKYRLMYHPAGRRVIFPVYRGDDLLGWQGRAIFNTEYIDEFGEKRQAPKLLGNPGLDREHLLMFQDNLKGSDHCILVEGPIDCIKCDLCGGNVASMGKLVNDAQLDIIVKSGVKRLYIGLDPDADTEAEGIKSRLADSGLEFYRLLPAYGYEDLGDMPPEKVKEAFDNAVPMDPMNFYFSF